jgi:hypothetical protein
MSERFYASLSTSDQQSIREAAREAIVWEREEYRRQDQEALANLEAAGVQITHPDRAEFLEAAQRVWRQSADRVDPALVEAIVRTGSAVRSEESVGPLPSVSIVSSCTKLIRREGSRAQNILSPQGILAIGPSGLPPAACTRR